ncbi:hypothetical protein OF83DRAFT_1151055 [Amylostereum chailletii]|nr:hypothetical protein OF83DRAFT_1151055 [Amylostereum chailletii]
MSMQEHKDWVKPLDDSLYAPDDDEKAFLKAATEIEDDEELKRHILSVQTKAFSLHQYPCIRIFEFTKLKMARLPAYPALLQLGRERPGAIFVDLGCCCAPPSLCHTPACADITSSRLIAVGNDVRKAVLDGYPPENILGVDVSKDLWDLGHEMFRSTPASFPVAFLAGDALSSSFLSPSLPLSIPSPPALSTLTSLNPLKGHVSALFTGAFFHLFTYPQQTALAHTLASLLAGHPGALLFGVQGGRPARELWKPTGSAREMHCHSPESWRQMWEGAFAGRAEVEVRARLRKEGGGDSLFGTYPLNKDPYQVLEWSVKLL